MWTRSAVREEGRDPEQGQDLVEYALLLPLFLLLVLGIIEFGVLYFQYSTVTNLAREAARAGLLPISETCPLPCRIANAEAAGRSFADAAGLAGIVIDASSSTATISRVRVTFTTGLITRPMIEAVGGTGTVVLHTSATMNRE